MTISCYFCLILFDILRIVPAMLSPLVRNGGQRMRKAALLSLCQDTPIFPIGIAAPSSVSNLSS